MKLKILKYIILIILLSYILKKKFKYQENLVNNQQSAIQKWNNATNNGTTYRGINNKSNTICVPFINNNEFYDSDVCSTQPNGIDWCATKTLATGEKDGSNWQWCSKINGTCKSGIGANADCYPRPNTNDANGYTIATCKSWNNNKNLSDAEFADVWTHSNNNLIKNNNKKYEPDFTCQPLTCPENDGVVDEGCTTARPYRSKISKHMGASDGKGKWCYNHKSCAESIDCWQKMKDEHGSGYCQDQSWVQPATCPINDNQKDVGCPDSSPYRSKWASHQTESDGKGKYCFNNKSCAESTDCWQEMSANNGSNYCQNEFWVNPLNAEKCPESDYPYRTRQRGHKEANYKYCYKTKNFALGIDTGGSTVWTDDYAAPNNYNPTWPCVCENDASGRNCNNSSGYSSTSSNWCYVSGSCENARIPYTNDEDGREGVVISGSKPWTYCSYMNPS